MSKIFLVDYRNVTLRANDKLLIRRINLADFSKLSFFGRQLKTINVDDNELSIIPSSLIDFILFKGRSDAFSSNCKFSSVVFYFSGKYSFPAFIDLKNYKSIEDYFIKNSDCGFFEVFSAKGELCHVNMARVLIAHLPSYPSGKFFKKNPGGVFKKVGLSFSQFRLVVEMDFSGLERDSDLFEKINPYLIGLKPEINGRSILGTVLIGDSWCSKEFISP